MTRPKHTKKDSNHSQVVADLREEGCTVIDVSDLPGNEHANPLDLFVLSPSGKVWVQVEVKPSITAEFTDNELHYMARVNAGMPGVPVIMATNAHQILAWFEGRQQCT